MYFKTYQYLELCESIKRRYKMMLIDANSLVLFWILFQWLNELFFHWPTLRVQPKKENYVRGVYFRVNISTRHQSSHEKQRKREPHWTEVMWPEKCLYPIRRFIYFHTKVWRRITRVVAALRRRSLPPVSPWGKGGGGYSFQ